jgi:acyl transferase domain-containing protein/3-hydroxymyristoyl/3-hydroxydecanoyl-(acyl carrier protein) dehydratase/1-acyl-sn-glycerol-3-phosphate acyltransferase
LTLFEPIAIIGQGCILPGCCSPNDLWETIYEGKVNITSPNDDYWRILKEKVTLSPNDTDIIGKKTVTDKGGYISEFESLFDPEDYLLDPELTKKLDPVFKWSFYAARCALKDAGYLESPLKKKTGVILGNLSYPSHSFNILFEDIYMDEFFPETKDKGSKIHPVNRFMSGLPAVFTGKALGLKGDAFALDAACSSSLYAIKLACDKLINGSEYMMLAGGVNAADSLFLHMGFTALKAISPTGQSRPFNKDADGLLPSEGCAFVMLKRLSDALKDGDKIAGVIRGIGLSNDGRSGGFLAPSVKGQTRCIKKAFKASNIDIKDISLVECHATGTKGGDDAEIQTMLHLFSECKDIAISSIKANLGHLITASGASGLIKVLSCIKHEVRPATPNAFPLIKKIENSNIKVLKSSEKWNSDRKIACISNFGFGGNNAHIIVEDGKNASLILKEWEEIEKTNKSKKIETKPEIKSDVAIVGIGLRINEIKNASEFLEFLITGSSPYSQDSQSDFVKLNAKELVFPPKDLKQALGQQLILLDVIKEAKESVEIDPVKTGVFIGMGVDPEINRYGMKWRLADLLDKRDIDADESWILEAEKQIVKSLEAAAVIGKMPNIPANRLNNLYNFQGQGFTVSCEELSGIKALEIAVDSIQKNEIKAAVVGAVDLSKEKIHELCALETMGADCDRGADAAVIIILKDYETAKNDGDDIFAVLKGSKPNDKSASTDNIATIKNSQKNSMLSKLGHSHAASGLLHVAAGALLTAQRYSPKLDDKKARPIILDQEEALRFKIENSSYFIENPSNIILESDKNIKNASFSIKKMPNIYTYSADDKKELKKAIEKDFISENSGECRLAIIASKGEKDALRKEAINLIGSSIKSGINNEKIIFQEKKIQGELAFAFTGAASAYTGMGKELLTGFPNLIVSIKDRLKKPAKIADWIYEGKSVRPLPFEQQCGAGFLSQIHADFSRKILEIEPSAVIGLSSGETNSMFAFGVWDDMDGLLQDTADYKLYDDELANEFKAVKKYWGEKDDFEVKWDNWILLASIEKVKKLLKKEERVYLTIINSPNNCVIGGDKDACGRIIEKIGKNKAIPLKHDIAVHAPVVKPFEKIWRKNHTRNCKKIEGIRFYSNYLDGVYETTDENVADALTGQALQTIDFPKIVNKAWNDGVRIFLEHGPRNSLSVSINEILQDKPHIAIPLDMPGKFSFIQAIRASAELWCAGVKVNLENLKNKYSDKVKNKKDEITLTFPLRMQDISIPNLSLQEDKIMEPAPVLAPISEIDNIDFSYDKKPIYYEKEKSVNHTKTRVQTSSQHIDFIKKRHKKLSLMHNEYLENQRKAHNAYVAFLNKTFNAVFDKDKGAAMPDTFEKVITKKIVSPPKEIKPEAKPEAKPVKKSNIKLEAKSEAKSVKKPDEKLEIKSAKKEIEVSGPSFTREQLKIHASGNISEIFGELFEKQDKYDVQVRMPEPPLLLCDRVTGIAGEPGSLGVGTVWSETDIKEDSWYIHNARMPAGILIESGQADLFAISWLGIDFHNKGNRAYRLLGCDLVYHGSLPQTGDTLQYDIHVDSHVKQGDVRIFFFHYDCKINGKVRISVRRAHAGFFTKEELAESGGVLWSPEKGNYKDNPRLELSRIVTKKTNFTKNEVEAYVRGDMVACFGEEFKLTQTHTRTPRSQGEKLNYKLENNNILEINPNFITKIDEFDIHGGPKKRGYLKSVSDIIGDEWYFSGHFKNDPCMPGTLMAEACLQMMSFYMTAIGLTLDKDGWRFEPVPEEHYKFICGGQVIPTTKKLTYEIFVDEILVSEEGYPTLFAHVFCTSDGIKAFLCERLGLRLIPDWPLTSALDMIPEKETLKPAAEYDGFKFDEISILNCAIGKPSLAFGKTFEHYDDIIRSPRLPGPPYLLISRIKELDAEMGDTRGTPSIIAEYDIPDGAWFFEENDAMTMPYAVLMEIALQPCGWLSTFTLRDDIKGKELVFRNLDGTAVQHREIKPEDKAIETKTKLTAVSKMPTIIILNFKVECFINKECVFEMTTTFGFFDTESMKNQKGHKKSNKEWENFNRKSNFNQGLTSYPAKYFKESSARLPASKLLMLDRIVGFWPEGGKEGLGFVRAEKDVVTSDWFFKAHFFQDPVQPGSLGVEALIQLIKFYMLHENYHEGMNNPVFQPVAIGDEAEWHYRGQVTPDKKLIVMDMEVLKPKNKQKRIVTAEARLWVDGLKIYHIPKISVRIIEGLPLRSHAKRRNKVEKSSQKKENIAENIIAKKLFIEPSHIVFDDKTGNCGNLPMNELKINKKTDSIKTGIISLNNYAETRLYNDEDIFKFIRDWEKALITKFLRRVVLEDPAGYDFLKNRPVLYLANHQNFIEPCVFGIIANFLGGLPLKIIAKKEHEKTWVGALDRLGKKAFKDLAFMQLLLFDRKYPKELFNILGNYISNIKTSPSSLLIFVEGKRAFTAGHKIEKISSVILELAIRSKMPIIPVRFAGGLPIENNKGRVNFTYGYGLQDYYFGKAIFTEELEKMNLKERSGLILNKINSLGAELDSKGLLNSDEKFAKKIEARMKKMKISESSAVFMEALLDYPDKCRETEILLDKIINRNTSGLKKDSLEYKFYEFSTM